MKTTKRISTKLLAFLMVLAMCFSLLPGMALAADTLTNNDTDGLVSLEQTLSNGVSDSGSDTESVTLLSDSGTYIGFTSDVHGNTSALENWFKNLPVKLTNMCNCGDYSYSNGSSYLDDFNTIVTMTNTYVGTDAGVYTTGNHCWANGGSSVVSQMESVTGFVRLGEATNITTDDYKVYGFGAYSSDGSGSFQSSDITALDNYLKTVNSDTPVFILSHYPLHYISGRTVDSASDVIDVLNNYPNAVLIWGHNHSQRDSHYG